MFDKLKVFVNQKSVDKASDEKHLVIIDSIEYRKMNGHEFKQVRYIDDSGSYSTLTRSDLDEIKVGDRIEKSVLDSYRLTYDEINDLQRINAF